MRNKEKFTPVRILSEAYNFFSHWREYSVSDCGYLAAYHGMTIGSLRWTIQGIQESNYVAAAFAAAILGSSALCSRRLAIKMRNDLNKFQYSHK